MCRYSEWMAERRTKRQTSDISGQAVASLDIISRKIFCNSTSGQIHSWGLETSRWLTYSIRIKINKPNPASSHAVQYHKLPSFHTAGCDVHNHEHNSTGTLLQFNDITDDFWLFLHAIICTSWGIIDWMFERARAVRRIPERTLRKLTVAMPSVLNTLGNASNVAFIATRFCIEHIQIPSMIPVLSRTRVGVSGSDRWERPVLSDLESSGIHTWGQGGNTRRIWAREHPSAVGFFVG